MNASLHDMWENQPKADVPETLPGEHLVYLALGSNIQPEENLRKAVRLLRKHLRVLAISTCWETEAIVGHKTQTDSPNFYNLCACIATALEREALKEQLLRPIEQALGRVRGADKYAPRTIDLDIVVFDGQVIDPEVWRRLYLALIFAEMLPDLRNPETGERPRDTVKRLMAGKTAIPHKIDFS